MHQARRQVDDDARDAELFEDILLQMWCSCLSIFQMKLGQTWMTLISGKNSTYKSRVFRVALLHFVGACGTLSALPWANVSVPVSMAKTVGNCKPGNSLAYFRRCCCGPRRQKEDQDVLNYNVELIVLQ